MYRNVASLIEAHNRSHLAVGDVQVFRGRCELHPVAFGKLTLCFAVDRDSLQTVPKPLGAINSCNPPSENSENPGTVGVPEPAKKLAPEDCPYYGVVGQALKCRYF